MTDVRVPPTDGTAVRAAAGHGPQRDVTEAPVRVERRAAKPGPDTSHGWPRRSSIWPAATHGRDLDQRPQAHDALVPLQHLRVYVDGGVAAVGPAEPATQPAARSTDHRAEHAGHGHGWLGEDESGEGQVVGARGEQARRPVEDGDLAVGVDEEVEGV